MKESQNNGGQLKDQKNYEIRLLPAEVRADEATNTIVGTIPYQTLSQDLGGFVERILPSAFLPALESEAEVWSLFQHDWDKVMGRRTTNTLILRDSAEGLQIEISPSNTSWSKDALEVIRHGDSDGFSFGFWVEEDNWTKNGDQIIRDLVTVELGEVSVVFNPAYKERAKIGLHAMNQVRSMNCSFQLLEQRQKLLELKLRA